MSLLERDISATASEFCTLLRVLDGRLAGAEHHLVPGTTMVLGHSLDSDIVLRGRETVGALVELTTRGDDVIAHIVGGHAILLGSEIAQGESIALPPYVPIKIGEYHVAVGRPGSERWGEANAIALRSGDGTLELKDVVRPTLSDQTRSRWTSLMSYLPGWMKGPGFLMVAAFALMLALAIEPLKQIVDSEINGVDDAQLAFADAGFAGVTVGVDPSGSKMLISGIVRDEAEIERLQALIDRRFSGAIVDIETTQGLARAASDMLSGQGIDAEAKPSGIGKIEIVSEYLPVDRQTELREKLKQDLPKLAGISFALVGARGQEDLKYFFNSEKYGLATYVDGEPGHLVTADGSFWFEGATLPTGHKIVRARGGALSFERAGQVEEIRLAPPPSPMTIASASAAPPASASEEPASGANVEEQQADPNVTQKGNDYE
ncbi:hypothetical protein [Parasphingorhabdus cellanae]|uniref:Yop protein translocation protein D periplasmic domain-containing protein n=1 Tax=Parasphingorhabdus cellanae TaxID=2806553 RepID=A0ABX7T3J7_9SPHN|nr:hypothetical protein [Parasphingorhabdus cellanae]QTD56134.1 hypothetical protein J4G78_00550 [Parasphingorhabdus cellanae]